MKQSTRAKVMNALIDRYGFEVMQGWANLHRVDLREDTYDTEWWLDDNDHRVIMAVNDVRDGHGDWTGIKQETEKWVYANADTMHDLLWDSADRIGCTVWEFLVEYGGLGDECSWALESILKREPIGDILPRNIGLVVGNEITGSYQSLAIDMARTEDDDE